MFDVINGGTIKNINFENVGINRLVKWMRNGWFLKKRFD
ncbi:MAG: hypothetical protein ACLS5G_00425 [Streptococcus sp.]